ncbi:unnamed protein product [Symbiodinium natans]|uniref:Uncharacterized protein n=1 Tax=Symbiodinium natans TaxID=878477 RepID=A0A812I803_9DINO|nr:unnamed protein product [Symbiodinium natans]
MVGSCGTVWKHAETCGNVARPCTLQAAGLSLSDLGCKVCKVCSIGRLWLLYCAEDILTQSSCLAPEDPEAKNCGADSKRICPASAPLAVKISGFLKSPAQEACNFCSGIGTFLPDATAFMEDGKPFSCQFALDQIRAGDSKLTCHEATEELVDCCARPSDDGRSGTSDKTDNWNCDLCAGYGDLNSTAVAMVIEGSPMTCSEAQDNLQSGRAPISCEVARDSALVQRCCSRAADDDAAMGLQNCSICGAEETFDAESIAYTINGEMYTCGWTTSCKEAQDKLQGKCCKCYLCSDGQSLIPDAAAEHLEGEPMACQEAQLLLKGNTSKPSCPEARRKWSEYCCKSDESPTSTAPDSSARPAHASDDAVTTAAAAASVATTTEAALAGGLSSTRTTTEDTEAEEYGEEAVRVWADNKDEVCVPGSDDLSSYIKSYTPTPPDPQPLHILSCSGGNALLSKPVPEDRLSCLFVAQGKFYKLSQQGLCLKTDTKDWNMTCSGCQHFYVLYGDHWASLGHCAVSLPVLVKELPEEECASTHFFETVGACERRPLYSEMYGDAVQMVGFLRQWSIFAVALLFLVCHGAPVFHLSLPKQDYTQACISCNWPCGRKASTSTTSTTTTTTLTTTTMTTSTTITTTTTTTTTSTSTSTITTTSTSTTTTTTTSTTTVTVSVTDRYHLTVAKPYLTKRGLVVPTRCFEFCDRTNVRSMYISCSQLSAEMCQSESFYETDLKGNRRHCILNDDERCTVDASFVCNASMPICQVSDDSRERELDSTVVNGTSLPPEQPSMSTTSQMDTTNVSRSSLKQPYEVRGESDKMSPSSSQKREGVHEGSEQTTARRTQLPDAIVQSVVAAAQECVAVGLNIIDIQVVVNATMAHTPLSIKSPAEMSLREAVEVAQMAGLSTERLLRELQDAGIGFGEGGATQSPAPMITETIEINPHGPDRVVVRRAHPADTTAAPSTSSQPASTSREDVRCSSLCSKQEVSDCGTLEPELCASEEFYLTSYGQMSLCFLAEGTCESGPLFPCEEPCSGPSQGRMGVEAVDRFCSSLCFKYKVSAGNCSTLQEDDCKSRMYYMDVGGEKVLCQWEAAGICSVDLSARCPQKHLCPSTTTTTTTSGPAVPPFCYTLCDKIDIGSHVSACEELTEAKCKTWQYYATINGQRALCSWSEIGVCSLATWHHLIATIAAVSVTT